MMLQPTRNFERYYSASLQKQEIFCDIVKRFVSFTPCQRQGVLAMLVCQCSRSYLKTLSTVVEPVYHKEFENTLKNPRSVISISKLKNIIYSKSEMYLSKRVSLTCKPKTNDEVKTLETNTDAVLSRERNSSIRYISKLEKKRSNSSKRSRKINKLGKSTTNAETSSLERHQGQMLRHITSWSDAERGDCLLSLLEHITIKELSSLADTIRQLTRDSSDISRMPEKVLLDIFQFLGDKDLCMASMVCKNWRLSIARSDVWKKKCQVLAESYQMKEVLLSLLDKESEYSIDWHQAYKKLTEAVGFFLKKTVTVEDEHLAVHDPVSYALDINNKDENIDQRYESDENDKVQMLLENIKSYETDNSSFELEKPEVVSLQDLQQKTKPETLDEGEVDGVTTTVAITNDNEIVSDCISLEGKDSESALETRTIIKETKNQCRTVLDTHDTEYESVDIGGLKSLKRVRILKGHEDSVHSIQFDSRRVMSGSADHKIRIWDVRSGKEIRTLSGHKGGVRCLKFDNKFIASASWDMTVIIWDVVKFHQIAVLCGHRGCVTCLDMNEEIVVSGSTDKSIRIWQKETWECIQILSSHQGTITSLCITGEDILSSSSDGGLARDRLDALQPAIGILTLKLWMLQTGRVMRTFYGHLTPILDSKVYGKLIASCSADGNVLFWNYDTAVCEAEIHVNDSPVLCLCFNLARFFIGTSDGVIQEWDVETCSCLRSLTGHKAAILDMMVSSTRIVSGSADGTCRIWDLENCVQQIGGRFDSTNQNIIEGCTVYESGFVPTISTKSRKKKTKQ